MLRCGEKLSQMTNSGPVGNRARSWRRTRGTPASASGSGTGRTAVRRPDRARRTCAALRRCGCRSRADGQDARAGTTRAQVGAAGSAARTRPRRSPDHRRPLRPGGEGSLAAIVGTSSHLIRHRVNSPGSGFGTRRTPSARPGYGSNLPTASAVRTSSTLTSSSVEYFSDLQAPPQSSPPPTEPRRTPGRGCGPRRPAPGRSGSVRVGARTLMVPRPGVRERMISDGFRPGCEISVELLLGDPLRLAVDHGEGDE